MIPASAGCSHRAHPQARLPLLPSSSPAQSLPRLPSQANLLVFLNDPLKWLCPRNGLMLKEWLTAKQRGDGETKENNRGINARQGLPFWTLSSFALQTIWSSLPWISLLFSFFVHLQVFLAGLRSKVGQTSLVMKRSVIHRVLLVWFSSSLKSASSLLSLRGSTSCT